MAKEFLSQKGYKFTEYDVTKDRAALDEMVKISGARSVPVIAACNEVMVGFDRTRLEQMLSCMKQRTEVYVEGVAEGSPVLILTLPSA